MQSSFDIKKVSKEIPVFKTILQPPNDGVLLRLIEEYREHHPEGYESNVKAWRSNWFVHKSNRQFEYFVKLVTKACNFLSHNFFHIKEEALLECSNMWFIQYENGDYTEPHDHYPSVLSSVYFVEVEDNCAPLIFEDSLEIQPEDGMLVIFPSILKHKVEPTDGKRTVVSMNFKESSTKKDNTRLRYDISKKSLNDYLVSESTQK